MRRQVFDTVMGCSLWLLVAIAGVLVPSWAQTFLTDMTANSDSASATVELIPAVAGQKVTVYQIYAMAAVPDTVTYRCGSSSTKKIELPLQTAGQGIFAKLDPVIQCAPNEAFNEIKTAGVLTKKSVWYLYR